MLMRTHDGAVNECLLEVGILGEAREDALPYAASRPAAEALIDAVPRSEFER